MRGDRLALIADARLPGDARVMGLFVLELGEGWHEVPHDQFRAILDGPSNETLRRHLRKLEGTGWIEAETNTGRRPPRYRIRDASETPSGGFRAPVLASLPHTCGGERDVSPTSQRGKEPSAPHRRGAKSPAGGTVGGGVVEGDDDEEAPPISPPELSTVAQHTIEDYGDALAGCRDSLREYVAKVVDAGNQSQYIHTVAAWVKGGDEEVWRLPDGGLLEPEKRVGLMAVAVNELGAGDEDGMYHRPGHTGNLRTKISAILKQRAKHGPGAKRESHGGRDTGPATRKAKSGQGIAGDRGGGFHYEGEGDDGDSAVSGLPAA